MASRDAGNDSDEERLALHEPTMEDMLACLKYLEEQAARMNLLLVSWQIGFTAASLASLIKTKE